MQLIHENIEELKSVTSPWSKIFNRNKGLYTTRSVPTAMDIFGKKLGNFESDVLDTALASLKGVTGRVESSR